MHMKSWILCKVRTRVRLGGYWEDMKVILRQALHDNIWTVYIGKESVWH